MRRWEEVAELLAWGWETRRLGEMSGIWNGDAAVRDREMKIGFPRERRWLGFMM
jgi:hypothetical protein